MSRNIALDILKIVLVFMVIELHLSAYAHSGLVSFLSSQIRYVLVDGVFRIAVPIFLMINGYFFYNAIKVGKYKKWLFRVTVLYILWMLIYAYFWVDLSKSPKELFKVAISGYWHLWYLNAIVGAGILAYLLRNLSTKVLIFLIITLFIIGLFIQYIGAYHIERFSKIDSLANWPPSHRNFLFLGFVFFEIGFLIHRFNLQNKISKRFLYIGTFIGLMLLILESSFNYKSIGDVHFDNLLSLIILSPALFMIFLNFNIRSDSKNLSTLATALYLIHPLFIMIYKQIAITDELFFTLLVYISAVIGSFLLIKANQKFKYLL